MPTFIKNRSRLPEPTEQHTGQLNQSKRPNQQRKRPVVRSSARVRNSASRDGFDLLTDGGLRASAWTIERRDRQREARRPYCRELTEFIGTFMLVFAGSGAAIVNQISEGTVTHVGVSFTSGAVLAAIIYAFGHLSGAHVNPAVTLAFWSSGFCSDRKVLSYLVAQVSGGVCASMLLLFALGPVANLGATLPREGFWLQAFILETVLTFIMMMVVFGAGLDRRAHIGFGGLAIGLTVALEVLIMGPITGGSMNPARSFAPALVAGVWQHQWLYWFGPILGGQIAGSVYRYISDDFSDTEADIDADTAIDDGHWLTTKLSREVPERNDLSAYFGSQLANVQSSTVPLSSPLDETVLPMIDVSDGIGSTVETQYLDLWRSHKT